MRFLIATKRIKNQQDVAAILEVDNGTISNWMNGRTEISALVKYSLAHIYDVPELWWDQPGIPIEEVIGKGLAKDEKPTPAEARQHRIRELLAIRELVERARMGLEREIEEEKTLN